MKVICVDDEQIALDEIRDVIGTLPDITQADFFRSPYEAIDWLGDNTADVAFMDIRMRQMDGLLLAKRVRELCPQCAVVFVTGYDQYAVEAFRIHPSGYLMKPFSAEDIQQELDHIKKPETVKAEPTRRVRAQTFGTFEFFVDEKPVQFKRSKTKELLAFLIDRRGAAVSTAEICAALWEEQSESDAGYMRHLISDLKKSLKAVDASDIFIGGRNSYAVNAEKIDCDAYRFRKHDLEAINSYNGEYLSQYSWAELTLGELESEKSS